MPISTRFFTTLRAYLDHERPTAATTDRAFVVLKGPHRGRPLTPKGLEEIITGARRRAGLSHGTCHELRHTCFTRLREAGLALEAPLRQVHRRHVEAYKLWLASREGPSGQPLKKTTINLRLGGLRIVIERLIEWDHPDAPTRNPIFGTDLPKLDEPLPKFLDDDTAAKFMAAAARLDPFRRLIVEMLARTGLRVGEFCALRADGVVTIGESQWLQVPVGKLHTDRYIPFHPILAELLAVWRQWAGPDDTGMLITNRRRPVDRYCVARVLDRCARVAGIGHVHAHQLRHTLATHSTPFE